MLKFEDIFRKGMPKHSDEGSHIPDQNSIMWEWQRFYEETKLFIEKQRIENQ